MGEMTGVTTLFFDLFFTLVTPTHDPVDNEYRLMGMTQEEWLGYAETPALVLDRALGRVREPEAIMQAVLRTLPFPTPPERAGQLARLRLGRMGKALTEVDPRVLSTLAALRERGLRLCLVSNVDTMDTPRWPESPLAPFFEEVLFSWQEGCAKPDPAFYRRALARMGVPPGEGLFIGDGGSDELAGAHAVGLRTVLTEYMDVKPPEIRRRVLRDADAVITDFTQLLTLIEP